MKTPFGAETEGMNIYSLPHLWVQPWKEKVLLLPLVPYKAFLSYISFWSHGSVHVYSLDSGLIPWNSG